MAFTVTDFIKEAQNGARPALFLAQVEWPQGIPTLGANARLPFLMKTANIPGMTLGEITIPFMGRTVKVAATGRTFDNWETTIINDEQFLVRSRLEAWQDGINGLRSNAPVEAFTAPLSYRTSAKITQFNQRGIPIRTYKFENVWPSVIAPIELSWESVDTIEEYSVTWTYDYFTATSSVEALGDIGEGIGERIRDILGS